MNADPRVMEHFVAPLSPHESDALVRRIQDHFAEHAFGWWALEVSELGKFVGFVGLSVPTFEAHFTPCVEIGWRIAFDCWGRGYATEGAEACLQFAFSEIGLEEVVSFTVPTNVRSLRVMEKLGMRRDPNDDFDHPGVPVGHPLQHHVLYRLARSSGALS